MFFSLLLAEGKVFQSASGGDLNVFKCTSQVVRFSVLHFLIK